MWCYERKRLRRAAVQVGVSYASLSMMLFVGSAAAAESPPPSLKVSGKAAFAIEARGLGDSFEVSAVLSDEVGRPLPSAEVRVRTAAAGGAATLHRCGASRTDLGAELLMSTDNAGRVCVSVRGMPSGALEFSYQDARGYFERASRTVRLPDSVATSFEVGFDPQLTSLSLDQATQDVGLLARAGAGRQAPQAAELVLSLAALGSERELGRAPLDGLGEIHRLTLISASLGPPGPARLIARLMAHDGSELARASSAVMLRATVSLSLGKEMDRGAEPGAVVQVQASSALGPVPGGIVEARSRGLSIAAAPVRSGTATLSLPAAPGQLGGALTLQYIGAGAGWVSGPALEVRVLPTGPAYGRYALWIAAAALAALLVVLGWRRPSRPRPTAALVAPRPRASVEVLEAFGSGGGYRGFVRDAHEGFVVSPAVLSFIGPGPQRPVLLQVRTNAQGAFEVEGGVFPNETRVEVTAPFHATLSAPLPVPGVLELSLVSRRRALLDRLVRWAERRGRPWSQPVGEPTPDHIAAVAAAEAQPSVERWARGLEYLAFGPNPPDAASEQAAGVAEDPTVRQESGID
jgi:hypothetical protein